MLTFDQILTDAVMFYFTVGTLAVMVLIMLWGFYQRDIGWLFCLAFNVPWAMITAGYYILWVSPDTPTILFPVVNILTRPGIVGVGSVVVAYSLFRVWVRGL